MLPQELESGSDVLGEVDRKAGFPVAGAPVVELQIAVAPAPLRLRIRTRGAEVDRRVDLLGDERDEERRSNRGCPWARCVRSPPQEQVDGKPERKRVGHVP